MVSDPELFKLSFDSLYRLDKRELSIEFNLFISVLKIPYSVANNIDKSKTVKNMVSLALIHYRVYLRNAINVF